MLETTNKNLFHPVLLGLCHDGLQKRDQLCRERNLHEQALIDVGAGVNILPEDARTYTRPLQAWRKEDQQALLPRALMAALNRFASTENVHDGAEAVKTVCESEYERWTATDCQ